MQQTGFACKDDARGIRWQPRRIKRTVRPILRGVKNRQHTCITRMLEEHSLFF